MKYKFIILEETFLNLQYSVVIHNISKKTNNIILFRISVSRIPRVFLVVLMLELTNFLKFLHTFYKYTKLLGHRLQFTVLLTWMVVIFIGRKEMFYLTTHSTYFIYGYMLSDTW